MPKNLSVLIAGSGAREHAISNAYEKSKSVDRIIVAPGNDFIGFNRKKEIVIEKNCSLKNPNSILEVAKKFDVDLIDVAQDDAIALGATDLLKENGFMVFGPSRQAARIEWDKRWSREFMLRNKIASPNFHYFDSVEKAKRYAQELFLVEKEKIVFVKAGGLCAGKGALKAKNLEETIIAIDRMGDFGEAGKVFLIEDGLRGEEFSYYAISDGKSFQVFKSAQDNKTARNFDLGEQTGGMGAISPARVTEQFSAEIEKELIGKAISGMDSERIPYAGILYLGGIIVNGKPVNIEYNARWGDPECQVVLPSIQSDYSELVSACLNKELGKFRIEQDDKTRVCVVGASRGYPSDYSNVKGKQIFGLEEAMREKNVSVFGAGIEVREERFFANGGRLFNIVAEGKNILEARQKAYSAIAHIHIEGNNLHYRTDIGWRDAERFLANEI